MVNLQKSGDSAVKIVFTDSDHYLYGNGEIEVPVNSLLLVIDDSEMVTFKKLSGDPFLSFRADNSNLGTKAAIEQFYKENMVGSTGGGSGSGVTPSEVQEMIDESVSGKADTTYVNQIAAQATEAITALTQTVSNNYTELKGTDESLYAEKFGDARYDSATHRINFYAHGNSTDILAYVDATDFIKDGMVSNVEIVNGNLVITFNSDAGKQPISIPLTSIFDPANYYTTAQTQSYVSGFTYDKATIDQKVAEGGTFDPTLYYDKTATDALLAAKADTATTYTKTEVDNALSSKADTTAVTAVNDALTAHTANTTVHVTSAEKDAWNAKQDALSAGTGIEISGNVISATGGGGMDDDTQQLISTAFNDLNDRKADLTELSKYQKKGDYVETSTLSDYMTNASFDEYATAKERIISGALNDLNDKFGGLRLVKISQTDYDNLATKDANTLYIINNVI